MVWGMLPFGSIYHFMCSMEHKRDGSYHFVRRYYHSAVICYHLVEVTISYLKFPFRWGLTPRNRSCVPTKQDFLVSSVRRRPQYIFVRKNLFDTMLHASVLFDSSVGLNSLVYGDPKCGGLFCVICNYHNQCLVYFTMGTSFETLID